MQPGVFFIGDQSEDIAPSVVPLLWPMDDDLVMGWPTTESCHGVEQMTL